MLVGEWISAVPYLINYSRNEHGFGTPIMGVTFYPCCRFVIRTYVAVRRTVMPRLFRRSHRYNVAKNCFLARIILLDNTSIEFNLLPEVTGSDCLEKVAQVLDIQEVNLCLEAERALPT